VANRPSHRQPEGIDEQWIASINVGSILSGGRGRSTGDDGPSFPCEAPMRSVEMNGDASGELSIGDEITIEGALP
jgi:hypothetical protein